MTAIGPDRTQTLEVLGTRHLLNVLRDQLEAEGVGVATTANDPPRPVIIEPVQDRLAYDIAIPIPKPRLTHNVHKLSALDPTSFAAIYDQTELHEVFRSSLKMEFATTETEVHQADLAAGDAPMAQVLLASITNKVMQRARVANVFAELYPLVRMYVATGCFGKAVDIEDATIRSHLRRLELQEGIARYLPRKIGELTVEKLAFEFANADFKFSDTNPFSWRRNLPPLLAQRTVFNYVATYNDFERQFAQFLDTAPDVVRFASLGTTEQGDSNTRFRVDYLKPSGAIGFYHPDWVVVQKTGQAEVSWIIETKGRVWEGTEAKDTAMHDWCARVTEQTGQRWQYARVNQSDFEARAPQTLAEAIQIRGQGSNMLI